MVEREPFEDFPEDYEPPRLFPYSKPLPPRSSTKPSQPIPPGVQMDFDLEEGPPDLVFTPPTPRMQEPRNLPSFLEEDAMIDFEEAPRPPQQSMMQEAQSFDIPPMIDYEEVAPPRQFEPLQGHQPFYEPDPVELMPEEDPFIYGQKRPVGDRMGPHETSFVTPARKQRRTTQGPVEEEGTYYPN